jgi:Ni/Co efflux regulator RcnB
MRKLGIVLLALAFVGAQMTLFAQEKVEKAEKKMEYQKQKTEDQKQKMEEQKEK